MKSFGSATTTERSIKQSQSADSGLWPTRFEMLDAYRGLGALMVVLFHIGNSHELALKVGLPGVIGFFVISGYCITASAESSLRKGFGFKEFMRRRVRRIYPPYLFSLLFFIATRLSKVAMGGDNQLDRTLLEYIQNFSLTQWLTLLTHPEPFAAQNSTLFVNVYWSLCYEEQFYLVIALMVLAARLWGFGLRWSVLAMAVVGLAWNLSLPSLSYGLFIEYWVHFAVGCLVFYRLCRIQSLWGRRLIDGSLVVLAAFSALMSWQSGMPWMSGRLVYNELLFVSVLGLVMILARPLEEWFKRSPLVVPLRGLGMISYSLYLIHQFNIVLIANVVSFLLPEATPRFVVMAAQVVGHIGLATVFWYLCERPFLNPSLDASPSGFASNQQSAFGFGRLVKILQLLKMRKRTSE